MARPVEAASVGVVILVGVAGLVVPAQVRSLFAPAVDLGIRGLYWANDALPRPVFVGAVFLATTVVAILVAISFGRVFYAVLRLAGPRTTAAYKAVAPSTPIGKVAFGFSLIVLFLLGSVLALPAVIGGIGEEGTVGGAANDIVNQSQQADVQSLLAGDALSPDGDGTDGPAYDRPTPDTDGDGLKDSWERKGRTPAGVRLPDADPRHKDLYVQVNYGGGTVPLSDTEKAQLREIWATMPVQNPDGREGVTIHLDDKPAGGGPLGKQVSISGSDHAEVVQYYTNQYVGARVCRYHQVVFGAIERDSVAGVATSPGWAAVVESDGDQGADPYSVRVRVITHELLHNVVGEISGDGHTAHGWLTPTVDPQETYLSNETAAWIDRYGFRGSGWTQRRRCGGASG
ncbi:MAG: hypothetical protein ABEJ31_13020 [Haloarculaceae archaeon]